MLNKLLIKLVFFIIQVFGKILSLIPFKIRLKLAKILEIILFEFFKFRRFTILRNIRIVFPQMSQTEVENFAREAMTYLCYYFLQYFEVAQLKPRDVNKRYRFLGIHYLKQAQALGKGYFLLTAHMGNPDMALKGLAFSGEKISLITKSFSLKFWNEIWYQLRKAEGLFYIPAHNTQTAYHILKNLSHQQGVIFVLDQFMSYPYGIPSYFFGRKTGTAYGLARFFLKSKAPIVPCFGLEGSDGIYEIHFLPPIYYQDPVVQDIHRLTDDDEKNLALVELFNRQIENIILQGPQHWMWIHRRWKRWRHE